VADYTFIENSTDGKEEIMKQVSFMLSMGRLYYGSSCQWGELPVSRVVHGASWSLGELSMGQYVCGGIFMGRIAIGRVFPDSSVT
jgi:hypothetical protein